MGIYIMHDMPRPLAAECEWCDETLTPNPWVYSSTDLYEKLRESDWGFDAWAGVNMTYCPKHADETEKENLARLITTYKRNCIVYVGTQSDVGVKQGG